MSSQKALRLLTLLTSSICKGQAPSTLLRSVPKTQTELSSKNWPTFFSQMGICMYVYICKHVCVFLPQDSTWDSISYPWDSISIFLPSCIGIFLTVLLFYIDYQETLVYTILIDYLAMNISEVSTTI